MHEPPAAARRLLIVDDPESPAITRCAVEGWDVLLLGRSAEWWRLQHPSSAEIRFVDPAPWAAAAHVDVAEFLIPWVQACPSVPLGGRTLDALLAEPEGSAWWWLETSEKGPYRGPLVGQLFRVALACRVAAATPYGAVHVAVREPDVAAALTSVPGWVREAVPPTARPWSERHPTVMHTVRVAVAAARVVVARWLAWRLAPPVATGAAGHPVIFTMFPAWWSGAFGEQPGDRFFGAPFDGGVAGYLAWIGALRQVWRHRVAVRATWARLSLQPLQRWSRVRDISWRGIARVRTFEREMRSHVRGRMAGVDVSPLLAAELSRALASGESIQDRALTRATARAIAEVQPSAVLYRLEWQPTEHAVVTGLRRRVPAVGFMHYPFGERYLAHRLAPREAESAFAGTPGIMRPLPDRVIVSGTAMQQHLTAAGYPADRIVLCGPQRYVAMVGRAQAGESRDAIRARLGWSPGEQWVLVAPAIIDADAEALAAAVWLAATADPSLRIIVRPHPNQPVVAGALGTVLSRLGPLRTRVLPASAPLYDALAAADALVCVGSMIAFEAMALGVRPIVFEHPSTYAATSLRAYADGLCIVTDGPSLVAALAASDAARAMQRDAWPGLLTRVFGDRQTPVGVQLARALTIFPETSDPTKGKP